MFTKVVNFLEGYVQCVLLRIVRPHAMEDEIGSVLLCVIAVGLFTLTQVDRERSTTAARGQRQSLRRKCGTCKFCLDDENSLQTQTETRKHPNNMLPGSGQMVALDVEAQ